MKNELKEIKKNLKATLTGFKDAKEEYGYDLANETYYVKQALKQVNLLLLHNVVGRSEQLPQNFCTLNRQTCGKGSGCKYPHCHL